MNNGASKKPEKEATALDNGQNPFQRKRISRLLENPGDIYELLRYNVTETSDERPGISKEVQSFPNIDLVGTRSPSTLNKLTSAVVPKVLTSTSELKQPKNLKATVLTQRNFSPSKKPTTLMNKTLKESHNFRRNMQVNSQRKAHLAVKENKHGEKLLDIEKLSDKDRPVIKKRTLQKRQNSVKVTFKQKISSFPTEEREMNGNETYLEQWLADFKIPKREISATDETNKKADIAATHVSKEQKRFVGTSQKTNQIASRKKHIKSSIEHPRSGDQNNTKRTWKRIVISEDDTSDSEENVCDIEPQSGDRNSSKRTRKRMIISEDDASDMEENVRDIELRSGDRNSTKRTMIISDNDTSNTEENVDEIDNFIEMHRRYIRSTLSVNINKLPIQNIPQTEKEVSDESELEQQNKFSETTNTVNTGVTGDELSQQCTKSEREQLVKSGVEDEVFAKIGDQDLEDFERSPENVHSPVAMEVENSESSIMLSDTNLIEMKQMSNSQQPSFEPAVTYLMEDPDCIILDTVPDKVVPDLICLDDDDEDVLIEMECAIDNDCPIISNADFAISETAVMPSGTSTDQQPRGSVKAQEKIRLHQLLPKFKNCEDVDDMEKVVSTRDQSGCQDIQSSSPDKVGFQERNITYTQTHQTDSGSSNSFKNKVGGQQQPYRLIPIDLTSNATPVVKDRCAICRKQQPVLCVTCHENCCFNSVCMPKDRRNCQKLSK